MNRKNQFWKIKKNWRKEGGGWNNARKMEYQKINNFLEYLKIKKVMEKFKKLLDKRRKICYNNIVIKRLQKNNNTKNGRKNYENCNLQRKWNFQNNDGGKLQRKNPKWKDNLQLGKFWIGRRNHWLFN